MSDPRARARDRARRSHGELERNRAASRSVSRRGRGIGFARYKNRAAYAAVVVELEVDEAIRLLTPGARPTPAWSSIRTA